MKYDKLGIEWKRTAVCKCTFCWDYVRKTQKNLFVPACFRQTFKIRVLNWNLRNWKWLRSCIWNGKSCMPQPKESALSFWKTSDAGDILSKSLANACKVLQLLKYVLWNIWENFWKKYMHFLSIFTNFWNQLQYALYSGSFTSSHNFAFRVQVFLACHSLSHAMKFKLSL